MLGSALLFLGETVEANALLTRQADLYDPEQHQVYVEAFGLDPGIIGRALWARTFAFLGRTDEARQRGEETIAIARRQRHPVNLVFALCIGMHTYVIRREPEAVLACAGETIDLCESLGLVNELEWTRGFQAWAIGERGDLEAAITQLRQGLDRQATMISNVARSVYLCILAEHLLHQGRFNEGHEPIGEAFAFRDRTGERFYEPELFRVQGMLFDAEGRSADAESNLRAAIAIARHQSAVTFELRAATALARLLESQPGAAEAARALVDVYGRFTQGLSTADVQQAAAQIQRQTT